MNDLVCVMFASNPDFNTESDVNKEGLECLRLLNVFYYTVS